MTTAERLRLEGECRGEQKGRQEGKQEAATAFLTRMIAGKFGIDPESFVPLLSGLEFSVYEQLTDKILDAESMEEVRAWLENASRN